MESNLEMFFIQNCERFLFVTTCCKCGCVVEDLFNICQNPECESDNLTFNWRFYLKLDPCQHVNSSICQTVYATGTCLNIIMGMPIASFLILMKNHPNICSYAVKYFQSSVFYMDIIYERVFTILLPNGNQLTFINWLGLQDKFDTEELISEILNEIEVDDDIDIEQPPDTSSLKKEGLFVSEKVGFSCLSNGMY